MCTMWGLRLMTQWSIIGDDLDKVYAAKVLKVSPNDIGALMLDVKYFDIDKYLHLSPLTPKTKILWMGQCPMDSVIMSLGPVNRISRQMHKRIRELTIDLYGDITSGSPEIKRWVQTTQMLSDIDKERTEYIIDERPSQNSVHLFITRHCIDKTF